MPHSRSLRDGNQIRLIEGGEAYFQSVIAAIDQARSQVHLETYIFDVHGTAAAVAEALERAALRGVRVWLVVDGVGTGRLTDEWIHRFEQAGVAWRIYSPLGTWGLLIPSRWRRLHRKLCVVDGLVAFCGGINILDDWYIRSESARVASSKRLQSRMRIRGLSMVNVSMSMKVATKVSWQ